MKGTLIYHLGIIPRVGDKVIVVINGKNFPSGVWYGILANIDLLVAPKNLTTIDKNKCIGSRPCIAKIHERVDPFPCEWGWRDKEPEGTYDVYAYAIGMDVLLGQINTQKAEVKALKQKLEEKEQKARDILKGLFDLAGVRKSTINQGIADFDSIYKKQ